MVENKWLGSKTKQGFYKKVAKGSDSEILSLNLKTLEYEPKKKSDFPILAQTKSVDDLGTRTKMLFGAQDKAGQFYRKLFSGLFSYVSYRIPEITDDIFKIDDALKAGFGWELGPFETWDIVGLEKGIAMMKEHGKTPAEWVLKMVAAGNKSFFKIENGVRKFYDIASSSYKSIPGTEDLIILR
jgi:3-hydroxyacyl-CoA dehydrogenase